MSMPALSTLFAFVGPNRFHPRPCVAATITGETTLARVRNAVKDVAQRVGLVIGSLVVEAVPGALRVVFATPDAAIGADLMRYVVAGLAAKHLADEEWDEDGQLWDLQKQRRAAALPLAALQLLAEAEARGVPGFVHAGWLQLGEGLRGWRTALADLPGPAEAPFARAASVVPWERLGRVDLVVLVGDALARAAATALAARSGAVLLADATIETTHALLADPRLTHAVLLPEPTDLVTRGTAFRRCARSALLDLPDVQLPRADAARALGVPLLLTDPGGRAALRADIAEIAALAVYAPCPVFSAETVEQAVEILAAGAGASRM